MTKEEAKQLKNGDKVLIEAIFDQIDDDGDAVLEYTNSVSDCERGFVEPKHIVGVVSETQPNKPKYDPCRLFKKGDKVKLRETVKGRHTSMFVTGLSLGKIYTVENDEFNHTVYIVGDEGLGRYSFVHLELVTPVEELEPYYVKDDGTHYVVGKRPEEPEIVYLAEYSNDRHPHAKEAAEAECARLNAEHRKEKA